MNEKQFLDWISGIKEHNKPHGVLLTAWTKFGEGYKFTDYKFTDYKVQKNKDVILWFFNGLNQKIANQVPLRDIKKFTFYLV